MSDIENIFYELIEKEAESFCKDYLREEPFNEQNLADSFLDHISDMLPSNNYIRDIALKHTEDKREDSYSREADYD